MFRRKLCTLDYHNPQNFNPNDESEFRNLILWLEDQKVRHYKVEERQTLRNICAGDWEQHLSKYLTDLQCPILASDRNAMIDWLLGYAVRLEYGDNVEKYKAAMTGVKSPGQDKAPNPLEELDFSSADMKAGLVSLGQLLQIPPHPDHLVTLKAISILIHEKLSKEAVEKHLKEGIKPTQSIPIEKVDLGFETSDYISQEAAKVLRLLHIKELRQLQDSANEAIVAVQTLTANPKTDTKLGKVGRM